MEYKAAMYYLAALTAIVGTVFYLLEKARNS